MAGQKHSDAPDSWRNVKHKRWLIFYQLHADGIEVMRVVDAVRDFPNVLRVKE
jgi:plasmid stabilization system protein ParE